MELKKVEMWLDVNKLSLNINKTNFVIFKSPQHSSPESVSIKIGSRPVKQTFSVKLLGVLLDENLSWKYHLKGQRHVTVNKPVISMIYIISHTWPLCSAQILVDGANRR